MMEKEIRKAILFSLKSLDIAGIDFSLEPGEGSSKKGDYATNVAFKAFSARGDYKAKNPFELSQILVKKLEEYFCSSKKIGKIEAVAPGFINFYFSEEFYREFLVKIIRGGDNFGRQEIGQGKTVVIDYSAPNIAKPFGIGHLRSTIIGQALYNIFSFLGYRVIGDNHLGDWGTQFGVLLYQIDRKKATIDGLTIKKLEKLYTDFYRELEKNPELKDEARNYFKRLEQGDRKLKIIWRKLVDLSLIEYQKVYNLLDVEIDFVLGESFYQDKMAAVLAEAEEKGLTVKSQGALIMLLKNSPIPAMLMKSDGATTYLLRDLAAIKYRVERWQPELIIYEVGADHKLHFKQVFEAAEKLGYIEKEKLVHVAHGMIFGNFGKLSTRGGKSIHLDEVLEEAITRSRQLSLQAGISKTLSAKERNQVATMVGVGAVKYNDLKQNPRTDISFDWQKVLTLDGDSGPYLQYTYARAMRVIDKSKKVTSAKMPVYSYNNNELSVVRSLCYFEWVVAESARTFSPNLVANFLYHLAQNYNTFYNRYQILTDNQGERNARLLLTEAVARVLKNGLGLLGIKSPQVM